MPILCINRMLSCAGTNRLQTSMKGGGFSEAPGDFCFLLDANGNHAQEAPRMVKFKFTGRQKIMDGVGSGVLPSLCSIKIYCVPQSKF
ncbi:hypothetical protein OIU77_026826 [Salix suchowensis]|uniref:Uncharacterized protein n=1 Tax=Salix suchowensis TaxID=1278906 RepID=A0ABQ9BQN2_9ROSI|nr:hypothetical protein OIU77_026826 [Salix suchowensis]